MTPMQHAMYDPLLVAVSVIIATFASYTALDLARSVSSARGLARGVWQCGGAVAMGVGIWSMHFVGMLALHTPGLRISYDIPLLVLSVVVAVIASGVALYAVSRPRVVARAVFAAGVAMGAAICGMHYIGIAGMNMAAAVTWNWVLVAASVAIAIIAAFAALWLAFRFRGEGMERRFPAQVCSAIAMGIAISGMHYTAMAAMQITPLSGGAHHAPAMARDVLASDGLAQAVIAGTLVILGIALASSAFQRALARRSRLAREQAADERAKIEAALRRAAELLSNSLQTGDVLREITTGTMEATAADLAYIEQIDPPGDAVVVAAAAGEWGPELHRSTALDQSITALLLASQEAFVSGCSTSVSHAAAADASEGGREMSFVAAGIRDGLRHAALVVARRPDQEPFGNEEITRVLTFSHLASLALRRLAQAEDAERRREELEQVERVAALGRVASSLAHQFNNILMSISAVSEAAARGGTIESFRRAAPQIDRAVARGKDVTETILRLNGATRTARPARGAGAWRR